MTLTTWKITSATNEQAQGVDQVNTAVAQMDKVTQQNAASAEESASASRELLQQSEHLGGIVDRLLFLVEGARGKWEKTNRESPACESDFSARKVDSGVKSLPYRPE